MRQTNVALAGSSGQLKQAFFEALPDLLETARVQAAATGESVDHLFESLVLGIKRGSPLLIDNTGLTLNLAAANEAYARSIGKSVAALTDQEKQIALIQATVAAGNQAIQAAGGIQETAATVMARTQNRITNILDLLAVSIQPIFMLIVRAVDAVVAPLEGFVRFVAPIIQYFSEVIAFVVNWVMELQGAIGGLFAGDLANIVGVVSGIANAIGMAFQWLKGFVEFILNSIIFIVNAVVGFINAIRNLVGNIIAGIFKPVTDAIGNTLTWIVDNAKNWALGGAKLLGGLVAGIYWAINNLLFPAVLAAADLIADFLVGNSPPPKGPLSEIDKGGANVMAAWMQGFAGVSLDPVEKVAAEVTAAMGSVATMSLGQVEGRLRQLDKAIMPFENRLAIVKSQFDALKEPAQAAMDAIDRELEKGVQALARGENGALEMVQALDRQRDSIMNSLDAQQGLVDRAQIQLALAKAQQAEERTLLNIRKQQLTASQKTGKVVADTAQKISTSAGQAAEAPKAATGSGTPTEAAPAPEQPAAPTGPNFGDELFAAFAGEIVNSGQLDALAANQAQLQDTLGRITPDAIGSNLTNMFSGLGDAFTTNLVDPAKEKIDEVINYLTNATEPGTLANQITNLPTQFPIWFAGLTGGLTTWLTTPFSDSVNSVIASFFGEDPTSFAGQMLTIATLLPSWFLSLPGALLTAFETPIKDTINGVINYFTNPENTEGGLAATLMGFFTGSAETEGTFAWILQQAINTVTNFPTAIQSALSGFAGVIWAAFGDPLIDVFNWLIDRVNEFLGSIGTNWAGIQAFLASIGVQTPDFTVPTFNRIEGTPDLQGGAKGGFFKGLFKVGERGPEYMMSSEKLGVLPNRMTEAFDQLEALLPAFFASAMRQPVFAGGNTTNTNSTYAPDQSMNPTFVNDPNGQRNFERLRVLQMLKK